MTWCWMGGALKLRENCMGTGRCAKSIAQQKPLRRQDRGHPHKRIRVHARRRCHGTSHSRFGSGVPPLPASPRRGLAPRLRELHAVRAPVLAAPARAPASAQYHGFGSRSIFTLERERERERFRCRCRCRCTFTTIPVVGCTNGYMMSISQRHKKVASGAHRVEVHEGEVMCVDDLLLTACRDCLGPSQLPRPP